MDTVDLWLPDLKYSSDDCASRLSGIDDYWTTVTENIRYAYQNSLKGLSSIIIRHLVLPNHFECCSKPILEWLAKETPQALVNIMDQYRPHHLVFRDDRYKDIALPPRRWEVEKVYKLADELGILWRGVSC